MIPYYILVIIATVLFSLQFLFNQKFQQSYGTGMQSALVFSFYKSIVVAVVMICVAGFQLQITLLSTILAVVYAAVSLAMVYFSIKAFEVANLSVYSVFSMLGGMLLPFVLGVSFYSEKLTVFKGICCALIVFAVLLNVKKGENKKKALLYYMMVFFLNGMAGVISKIHQSSVYAHVNSSNFMFLSSIAAILIAGIWLLIAYKKIPLIKGKELLYASGYGVFNGVGNWLLLISLIHLPASVQYPLVTGGVMVLSTVISAIGKEKLVKRDYIAAAIAFVASVCMAL